MKLTFKQYLTEAASESLGIIVENVDGKFEDISLVVYKTLDAVPQPSHNYNLGKMLVRRLDEFNMWDKIEKYLKQVSKGNKLGPDYSDNDATLYGPFTTQQISDLIDHIEENH